MVPESEARISIYDSALMFGDMVFEMTRSFNKKQFLLEMHIDRLFNGLKILEIDAKLTKNDLIQICHQVQAANEPIFEAHDEHRLMINVSRGPLGIYANKVTNLHDNPTVIVADFPLRWTVQGMDRFFDEGIHMITPSQRSIPAHLMDPKIKNRSRLWYQMANIQVSKHSGNNNWALLIDDDGYVTEGTGCNFFIVKNQKIITPKGHNVLRGTRRQYIFTLSAELGIECIESDIEPYDIHDADEAFVTGTPFCLMPVTKYQSLTIGSGKLGPITSNLLLRWSENVGIDIIEQIRSYNSERKKDSINSPYKFK